MSTIAKIDD